MFSATGFDHDDWVELVFVTGTFTEGKEYRDVRILDEPDGMSIITNGMCIDLSYEERNALRDYFTGKLTLVHAPEEESGGGESQ